MDFVNFFAVLVAAIVPLVIGFIWYHPKFLGTAWMREAEMNEAKMKKGNMALIFSFSLLFSLFIAFCLQFLTVHQTGAFGMIGGDVANALPSYSAFLADYGTAFRTFKHGALHGILTGVFLIFPLMAINALFERKSWKYIFINSGYWTLCLTIMGGIICGWV
jgi:hypothetical protein